MGDQDVRVDGDQIPPLPQHPAPRQVEGPIAEGRLPGGAPHLRPSDLAARVLQVGYDAHVGVQELPGHHRVALEEPVVVARHQDPEAMRLGGEPVQEVLHLMAEPLASGVPGVDQHVAVGDLQLPVPVVGVADADDFHGKPEWSVKSWKVPAPPSTLLPDLDRGGQE